MTNQRSNQLPFDELGTYQATEYQATKTHRSSLVREGGYPFRGTPPLPGSVGCQAWYQPERNNLPSIEDLTELRTRLNAGVSWCNQRAGTEKAMTGRQRLIRIAAKEYLPALHRWRSAHSRDEITAARDAVRQRLERGWDTPNAPDDDPSTDRRAELFADLLTQYEVFEDMLSEHVIANTMDRVLCG